LRTIKKYQNRRLYDTQQSTYVTLETIREMITRGEEFCIIDAKNASLLANLIRFYGDSLQGVMGEYLEDSVNRFLEKEGQLREQMHSVLEPRSSVAPEDSPKH